MCASRAHGNKRLIASHEEFSGIPTARPLSRWHQRRQLTYERVLLPFRLLDPDVTIGGHTLDVLGSDCEPFTCAVYIGSMSPPRACCGAWRIMPPSIPLAHIVPHNINIWDGPQGTYSGEPGTASVTRLDVDFSNARRTPD